MIKLSGEKNEDDDDEIAFFPATDMNEKYPKIVLFQQFLAKMVFLTFFPTKRTFLTSPIPPKRVS